MRIRTKFWLEDESGEPVFGEGRRRILELIDELGSMQATAKILNMSYRGVWARIKVTEQRLGIKLVETTVGRSKNQGSRLTAEARKLLSDYQVLTQKGTTYADDLFQEVIHGRAKPEANITPVVAVVGPAGAGKTGLIKNLIREWTKRGRRVGNIATTEPAETSPADSNQEWSCGAVCQVQFGPTTVQISLPPQANLTPETVAANYCLGCDLALLESRQRVHLPTIEVYRQDFGPHLLTRKSKHLLAVVGDRPGGHQDKPCFRPDDLGAIVDLVEAQIILLPAADRPVNLSVNGRRVPMLPFVQDMIANTVAGLVSALKSCETPQDIKLEIKGAGVVAGDHDDLPAKDI